MPVICSTRHTCIFFKSGWSSTAGILASSSDLFLCLRLTPRRHRQTDGRLSPLYPPSSSFSSFGAVCVGSAVSFLPRWSEISVCAVSSTLKCRRCKRDFALNLNIK